MRREWDWFSCWSSRYWWSWETGVGLVFVLVVALLVVVVVVVVVVAAVVEQGCVGLFCPISTRITLCGTLGVLRPFVLALRALVEDGLPLVG